MRAGAATGLGRGGGTEQRDKSQQHQEAFHNPAVPLVAARNSAAGARSQWAPTIHTVRISRYNEEILRPATGRQIDCKTLRTDDLRHRNPQPMPVQSGPAASGKIVTTGKVTRAVSAAGPLWRDM
jgi:hypothetical protein